jgi:hypothetical protein
MADTLTHRDDLIALLAELRGRGVTFVLDGNRLKIRPWRELTMAEADTVQVNRQALKELIRGEVNEVTTDAPTTPEPTPTPAHTPKIVDPDIMRIITNDTTAADAEATRVMLRMVGRGCPCYRVSNQTRPRHSHVSACDRSPTTTDAATEASFRLAPRRPSTSPQHMAMRGHWRCCCITSSTTRCTAATKAARSMLLCDFFGNITQIGR